MIKNYLAIALMFITASGYCQAFAIQPPDMQQCDNSMFDLTQQNHIILNESTEPIYTVGFYHSLVDAQTDSNVISNPEAYASQPLETIFVRVFDITDSSYATTSFQISWNTLVPVDELPDVTTCDYYTLPDLEVGFYFGGPGGTGGQISPFQNISSSMIIYIYKQTGSCISESSFIINIVPNYPVPFVDISACTSYILPEPPFGDLMYFTEAFGQGTVIPAGTVIMNNTTIYPYSPFFCLESQGFDITIGTLTAEPISPLRSCDNDMDGFASFDFSDVSPQINGESVSNFTFHQSESDAQAGLNAISAPYTNTVANTQTIYIRLETQGGCYAVTSLTLLAQPCSIITGTVRVDMDGNGCNGSDATAANIPVYHNFLGNVSYAYTNADGQYTLADVFPGNHNLSVAFTTPGFTGSSPSITAAGVSNYTADLCLTPFSSIADASVVLYPTNNARPGLQSDYNLIITNHRNTILNGTVTLAFDAAKLNFIYATPSEISESSNLLTFSYSNLEPLDYKVYHIAFMVEPPPTVNAGDYVSFMAHIETDVTDSYLLNNDYEYIQPVVNSFDPNDKIVLESSLDADNTDDYLHYVVRFQNTGTAAAEIVVVKDELDANVDLTTFRPIDASHIFTTEMDAYGKLTFTFNNIDLPSEDANEPASHGYVSYKVRLKSGLTVNDDIYNTANIYFDFNAPIITNTVMTDLLGPLGIPEIDAQEFAIYPNPASDVVRIRSKTSGRLSIEIYDIQGKIIIQDGAELLNNEASIAISELQSGLYFLKLSSDGKSVTKKLVVK